jgi:hypothetical protein
LMSLPNNAVTPMCSKPFITIQLHHSFLRHGYCWILLDIDGDDCNDKDTNLTPLLWTQSDSFTPMPSLSSNGHMRSENICSPTSIGYSGIRHLGHTFRVSNKIPSRLIFVDMVWGHANKDMTMNGMPMSSLFRAAYHKQVS